MGDVLRGSTIAFLAAAEGTEQVELTTPWKALADEGATLRLVSPAESEIQMFNHLDKGDTWPVDVPLAAAHATDFDGLVLPGGVANPDQLRTDERAVQFVRAFVDAGKPIAVICHGPWTLVEADALRGRTITSWPSLRTDVRNAGGTWVDQEVAVCAAGPNVLVSSRKPDDLPAFVKAAVHTFAGA